MHMHVMMYVHAGYIHVTPMTSTGYIPMTSTGYIHLTPVTSTRYIHLTPIQRMSICSMCTDHFIVISDGLGLLQSLKPHHVLDVKPPRQLFKCLCCHVLCLWPLHMCVCVCVGGDIYITHATTSSYDRNEMGKGFTYTQDGRTHTPHTHIPPCNRR